MSSTPAPSIYRILVLMAVMVLLPLAGLPALDITLNGRNIKVMDTAAMAAFATTPPGAEVTSLPLSVLYPWLESIEYVEAQSGANRVYWEGAELDDSAWYAATLQRHEGIWQIHLGQDVFSDPDRIAVRGVAVDIDRVTIWSSVPSASFRSTLESLLALRDIQLEWRQVTNLEGILADPPSSGLPHLVVTGALERTSLDPLLTSWRSLSTGSFRWYGGTPADPEYPESLAADAYHPEAALYFAARNGSSIFSGSGLSPEVSNFLEWAAAARTDGRLLVTETPISSVANGRASLALILPSSAEGFSVDTVPALAAEDLTVSDYLAIPTGLSDSDTATAKLLLDALTAYLGEPESNGKMPDDRLPDFFKAYERIGRLVISGQMSVEDGMDLMNRAISEGDTDG